MINDEIENNGENPQIQNVIIEEIKTDMVDLPSYVEEPISEEPVVEEPAVENSIEEESIAADAQEKVPEDEYTGRSVKELKMIHKIEKEKNKKYSSHRPDGFFLKVVTILLLACVLAGIIVYGMKVFKTPKTQGTTTIQMRVESTLTSCQELVTYKYRYKQVDFIKHTTSSKTKNSSYVLLKYAGILRAGIEDLNKCTFEYSEDEKTLKITTPEIKILGNEISSYEVLDEYQKLFNILSVSETMRELDKRKLELENEAIENGLLAEAAEHAKLTLEKMFLAAGFETVEVVYPKININDYLVDEAFEMAYPK